MSDFDYFNQLKGKVHELKVRRDEINADVMQQRITQTQLDDQIQQLERQRQQIKLDVDAKEAQIKKYNTLVEQSEEALNKMIANSQRLNETLTSALNSKI